MIELLNIDCMEKEKKVHHWTGRKHTEETKLKMREARLKNNPMHNPDVVAKRSKTLKERGTFAKENSNTWKGGITSEQVMARNSDEYKVWRDAVFNRDGFSCRHCGDKCGNGHDVHLHAHHIKSFAKHPELRFDVKNGVTLCKACHYKVHKNG